MAYPRWEGGFLVDASGNLMMTTDLTGARWNNGYLRSPTGALVVVIV